MKTKNYLAGISIFSLCAMLSISTAVMAAPTIKIQTTKPIYSWRTESEKNKDGQFDHCLVKNMYDNGTLMILAQNSTGEKRIALNFPQNKLEEGQHFDLAIQIDRRDVFPVEAIAINAQTLAIGIPEALPDQMRKGQLLHLRGPNDEVVFAMDGMSGAVMSLQDCMITQKNMLAPSVMTASNDVTAEKVISPVKETKAEVIPEVKPDAKPEAKQKPAALPVPAKTVSVQKKPESEPSETLVNPIPDKILPAATTAPVTSPNPVTRLADKIEAMQDNKVIEIASDPAFPQPWQGIFAGTAYSPERLIPMKNKTADQPLDYIWKKDDLFIGVKAKTVNSGDTLGSMSTNYLKMLKTRCAGNFVAENTAVQQAPNVTWQIAEAACSNSSNGDSIAAIIFAANSQGGQIYFFESKADKGAGAIKARDAVLKKVLQ